MFDKQKTQGKVTPQILEASVKHTAWESEVRSRSDPRAHVHTKVAMRSMGDSCVNEYYMDSQEAIYGN